MIHFKWKMPQGKGEDQNKLTRVYGKKKDMKVSMALHINFSGNVQQHLIICWACAEFLNFT